MDTPGSTALITGGASGLGAATARRLAGLGARVVLADINRDAGDALVGALGAQASFIATDVTDSASMQAAVDAAAAQPGQLRILVCCAGVVLAERVLGKAGPSELASFA
ncbi:MAG: SDR family NAD(P)-dependent oxidoreductase, partial [Kouleothrix sp.]